MSFRPTPRLLAALRGVRVAQHSSHAASRPFLPYGVAVVLAGSSLWLMESKGMLGSSALLADAAARPDIVTKPLAEAARVDPDTDISFPVTLPMTAPAPLLSLVGLGVRTVSFLRVKVYSVGFYLEEAKVKSSKAILTDPAAFSEDDMKRILDLPTACAARIVPTRNTDFGHLRDGFTRAIAARQKLVRSSLTEADEERIANTTQTIKSFFPAQSAPKGKAMTLLRTASGSLIFEYEGKILGQVEDAWVSRELMLAYFADKGVISPKLKADVAKGLVSLWQ